MYILTITSSSLIDAHDKWLVSFDFIIFFLMTWMSNGMFVVTRLSTILGDMGAKWHVNFDLDA
jgi:hypothetical protein